MGASSPLQAARRRHCSWFYLKAEKSQARANCCLTAFAADPDTVGAMVDNTMSGHRLADLASSASLWFLRAPRAPTVPSIPEAELPAREGRDQDGLLLAARGCGVLVLPRADWPRNVNSRYLNLGRAHSAAVGHGLRE